MDILDRDGCGRHMGCVAVTGATSMIGTALIKECIKNGVDVLAIVRKGSVRLGRLPKDGHIEILECGLGELASIPKKDKTYDVFYHFAWAYTSRESRDDPRLQEENIRHTLDAVDLAARLGCRKFIGAGSQAEYGPKQCVITPGTEISPQISYGMAKYAAGMLSRKLCIGYGMAHIWGRIFSVYGGNDNEGTMLAYAIGQFLKGEPARFSSASQMWDYLHEDDAGRIFYLLGERVEENKVYCIASGKSRPLKEFIMEMKEAFGPGAKCEFAPEGDVPEAGLQADASGLFQDIAYRPVVGFQEGVRKMIGHIAHKTGQETECGETVRKLPCEKTETQNAMDINGINGELYPSKCRNNNESGENKNSQMSFRTVCGG